ncbi:hypothetical protein DU506_07965 [Vreelandella rituensis]|uniref:Uncharacterized protein n=1 Tax=Vreelandella rituensis TaxID=2282306 RepID=A0A368UAT4_9GAMM|nr:hypothetical protein DU506_07965 [Halomonas rituensis]
MKQNKKKVTRRERFLAHMGELVTWQRLVEMLSSPPRPPLPIPTCQVLWSAMMVYEDTAMPVPRCVKIPGRGVDNQGYPTCFVVRPCHGGGVLKGSIRSQYVHRTMPGPRHEASSLRYPLYQK